jgi:hypothetical protein
VLQPDEYWVGKREIDGMRFCLVDEDVGIEGNEAVFLKEDPKPA